jgi:hypothetical protein
MSADHIAKYSGDNIRFLRGYMTIAKNDADTLIKEFEQKLERSVIDCFELLDTLFKEDDWSFVIKSHALIESIITQLLTESSKDSRFIKLFERLPLSSDEIGKLSVAKALDVLNKNERKFIKYYSTLRNNLVHNIDNINYSFNEYMKTLDKNQLKELDDIIHGFINTIRGAALPKNYKDIGIKEKLLSVLKILITDCSIRIYTIKLNTQIEKMSVEKSNSLVHEYEELIKKQIANN